MRISFRIKRLRSTPPRATGWFYMRSEWNRVVFFFFFFFPATKLLHFSHHVIRTSDFIHSARLNEGNQTYIVNTRLAEKCNTNTLDFLHTSDIYRKKRKKFPSYDLDCTEKKCSGKLALTCMLWWRTWIWMACWRNHSGRMLACIKLLNTLDTDILASTPNCPGFTFQYTSSLNRKVFMLFFFFFLSFIQNFPEQKI